MRTSDENMTEMRMFTDHSVLKTLLLFKFTVQCSLQCSLLKRQTMDDILIIYENKYYFRYLLWNKCEHFTKRVSDDNNSSNSNLNNFYSFYSFT